MRSISHLVSLPKSYFGATRDLKILYYDRVIRDLVNKLVFFFFPIYLFDLGKAMLADRFAIPTWQAGISVLAGYYILYRFLVMILVIPIGRLTTKTGYQRALIYSYVVRMVSFLFFFLSVRYPQVLGVNIVLEAIQVSLYWPAYHTLLAKNTLKKKMGSQLGVAQVLLLLAGVMAPAISGLLNTELGFQFIFFVGLVGTAASLCVVLLLGQKPDSDIVSWPELVSWLKERRYERFTIAISGRYIYDTILYLWPLYLFILFGTVERVGFIASIALFLALIVTVIATVKLDAAKKSTSFRVSGTTIALTWLFRTQVFSIWGIALADAVDKVSSNYHWLSFDMTWYKRGKGSQAHSYFVYHELLQSLALVLIWLVVLVILLTTGSWQALFVIAGIGTLLTLLLREK